MIWWMLATLALAQDAPVDPEPQPVEAEESLALPVEAEPAEAEATEQADASDEPEPEWVDGEGYEIIVHWGQAEIRQARAAVVRRLEDLGYEQLRTNGQDEIVFRPPKGWMGKVFLGRDGLVHFGTPVVGMFPAQDEVQQVGTSAADNTVGYSEGVGVKFWVLPAKRKLVPIRARVMGLIEPELLEYRQVIADTAFMERREQIPGELDALWENGTPLEGAEGSLATFEERRKVVLDYWASRPDSREGLMVAHDVEKWLENVVMHSEHPVTAEEQDQANQAAVHIRRLDLLPE